jgi:hypothetical protein
MAQRLTLQILKVTFPSLRSLHSLVCEVKLRDFVQTVAVTSSQHPFKDPVLLRETGLSLDDSIELCFIADGAPIGFVSLVFNEHFQFALEGEFDKWVQVKALVTQSRSMQSLHDESSPSKRSLDGSPQRQSLVRIRLSIEAPDTPEEQPIPAQAFKELPVYQEPTYSDHEEASYAEQSVYEEEPEEHIGSSTGCARCAYLEKLTSTQKNELKCEG